MNPFEKAITNLRSKIWNFGQPKNSTLLDNLGWHSTGSGTMGHYYDNDYENAYGSIRVIANSFAVIEPYTIDENKAQVASNILDRLYTPNTSMSAYDFRHALGVMVCVHDKVYIRVHKGNARNLTADSITGFTFLEGVNEHIVDGKVQYWLANGEHLTPADVIVLKDTNPYTLHDGFSPAFAARRWTTIDDLIADYQAGFFRNGAVPAGQYVITAKTAADYRDIVKNIKAHHEGSGNNNGVMFAHRPTDATGKPVDAQIEWIPFSTQNKDMALKDLFEQAERKIDSVYGVPAEIRGFLSNSNYASVSTAERVFVKYTLQPFALKIWTKFTHELNRITGGTGIAISFKLEIPELADEQKVQAEAQGIKAQTLINLTEAGYTPESAISFIATNNASDLIKLPKEEEKPDVLNADEANDTPEQPIDPGTPTKSPKVKALSPEDRADYELKLETVVKARMTSQIDTVISTLGTKATSKAVIDAEEDELLTEDMLAVLYALIMAQGVIEHAENIALIFTAGIDTTPAHAFDMTGAQRAAYRKYVSSIASGYNDQTSEKIRNILTVAREQNLPVVDIKKQLKGLIDEDYRIKRLAVTETNLAGNEASLWSMQNIARDTGANVVKIWQHTGPDAPCGYCKSTIGARVGLDEDFIKLNDTITAEDGSIFVNEWKDINTGGLHANCHCRQTYEVIR